MAEVLGPGIYFFDGAVSISVYYDDVSGQPTRVVTTNSGNRVACFVSFATSDFSREMNYKIPAGTSELAVTPGMARKINILNEDYVLAAGAVR